MFIAYFDDSGHSINSPVLTVAGVVAKASKWESFEEKWAKRLRRAKVPMFHMTDYESGKQDFTGWGHRKRMAFIVDLAAIVKNTIECGVGASVLMEDWQTVMPKNFVDADFVARRGPYSLLFQICLEKIEEVVKVPASETIACVFDENNFVRGAIAEHYRDVKKGQKLENTFGALVFDNKANLLPLQAADMVAYEAYKHVTNQIVQGGKRAERKLHANLWSSKRVFSFWLDQAGMRRYIEEAKSEH